MPTASRIVSTATSIRGQNGPVLFADLVAVSGDVDRSDARKRKVAELSGYLRTVPPEAITLVTQLLTRARPFAHIAEDHDVAARDVAALTCDEVSRALEELERAPADPLRRHLLHELMARATLDEQRWIRAAVDDPVIDQHAFDLIVSSAAATARVTVSSLRRAATMCGSLSLAVRIAFERGEPGLETVALEPGRPISVTSLDGEEPPDRLLDDVSARLVEWYVGTDRVQVHRLRGEVTVYDEHLNDVTEAVPNLVDQVTAFPRADLVLDGWVTLAQSEPAESMAGADWTRRTSGRRNRGQARFFDVLFDGAPVVDEPLSRRRELLESIVPGALRVPTVEITDLDDLATAMNEAMQLGYGGFVIKPLDVPYEGGLSRSSWRRVGAAHVVKLAVVAAERGRGSRTDLLSTLHLAARDDRGRLREVGSTARGLSQEAVLWQTHVFADLTIDGEAGGSDRLIQLRPDVLVVTAISGVEPRSQGPDDLLVLQPRVIGHQQHRPSEVSTIDELRQLTVPADPDDTSASGEPRLRTADPASPSLPSLPAAVFASASLRSPQERPVVTTATLRTPSALTGGRAASDMDFEPYEEPMLVVSRRPWAAVLIARLVALAWVAAMLAAALAERSNADAGAGDGSTVANIGRAGLIVIIFLATSGWVWCDQMVQNLQQLDGRRPGRVRCVTAWIIPGLTAALLAVLIVPLEPTEPADVRPVVIAIVFSFAMWRPYALIRRILTTLSRLRSDVLIASAYLIDVAAFGVVWWRLTLWGNGVAVSPVEVDIMVGSTAAVSIAMLLSALAWTGLLRACRHAVEFRRLSQRTRYEHRMLRLRGVDPTDVEVWWALVQRRADEQREAAARSVEPQPDEALPTIDELVDVTRRDHSVAFRRLGDDEAARLEEQLRAEFAAILSTDRLSPIEQQPPDVGTPNDASTGDTGLEDPIEAIRRRTGSAEPSEPTRVDVESLIDRAGSLEVSAALANHRERLEGEHTSERMVPPRLVLIEAIRLVMVATFGALTIVAVWLISVSLSSNAIGGTGELAPSVVTDLEPARKIFWGLLTAGASMLPLWALAVIRQARRAGVPGLGRRRVIVLAIVAIAACVGGFVVDGGTRGTFTLVMCVPIIWSAVAAGFAVEPVRVWFDLPAATLTAGSATLPVILGVAWLAGLAAPIAATASLQRLAFTTILIALGCARVTVMSVLSSLDVEDELRISPELAVPARQISKT